MDSKTGVVSQVNINDIIEASKKIEVSAPVITSAAKTIDALLKSFKEPTKTLHTLATVQQLTTNYCSIIDSVVASLVKSDTKGNTKNLADLLGRIQTTDPKDASKKIEKWTVVDAAMQIPNVLDTVFKVMTSVSEFDFNKKQIKKMKHNIIAMQVGLTDVFDTIFAVFNDISASKDFDKILKTLVNEPDTITNIIQNNTGDESVSTDQYKSQNKIWDKSLTTTTTKHGRMGLLDAMEKIFSLVGVLNTLKAPNLLKLKFQISRIGKGIRMTYFELTKQLKDYATPEFIQTQILMSTLLSGDDKNDTPGLTDIFVNVGIIFKKIESIKFNWVKFKMTQFAIRRLIRLVKRIIEFTKSPELNEFIGKPVSNKIDHFTGTLKKFCSVFDSLSESYMSIIMFGIFHKQVRKSLLLLIKLAQTVGILENVKIPEKIDVIDSINNVVEQITDIQKKLSFSLTYFLTGWAAFRLIKRFIRKLPTLVDAINEAADKIKDKNTGIQGIKEINDVISSITEIQKNILLSALLFIPASIGMICMIGFVWLIIGFVNVLSKFTDGKKFTKTINITSQNILKITNIILALVVVAGSILAFSIIAVLTTAIIKNNVWSFVGMLIGTLAFIGVTMYFASLISELAEKASKNVAMNIIMISGCFIIAALAILVAAVVGEKFRSGEVWANLAIGIGVIILVSTAMVGLGIALSFAAPFMGMATAGVTPLLVVLGMILVAGLTIVAIGAISFDFGSFTKGKDPKSGKFGTGTKAAGNVGLVFEFVKYLVAQIGKGYTRKERKVMKKTKKMLKQVVKTVKHILSIAESLNTLQTLEISTDLITANVTTMFTFINGLEDEIATWMNKDKTNPEDIIDAAKVKKKAWRKSKKALSKVEATIAMMSGIADSMMILKDFKFEDEKQGKNGETILSTKDQIIKNVESIFGVLKTVNTTITKDSIGKINNNYLEKITLLAESICSINESFVGISEADTSKLEKNIGQYGVFVDKINTIEVNKLQTASQMFEQMSKFSTSIKGDFDKLAESLADKLLPVLEELKEVMGVLPEKIDIGFQNTSASIGAANAAPTKENVTAQVTRENPNKSPEAIAEEVASRMNEKAKADANGIAAKLDELISMFKGYGEIARVQITT
jgi:hypothetical protein